MIRILLALVVLALGAAARSAEPQREASREIGHLLDYLGQSGCQFGRNGSWYGAAEARRHLERKLGALSTRGLVRTAEDFVERAASESTTTGKPYQVRCGGGEAVPCRQWLTAELGRYRQARDAERPLGWRRSREHPTPRAGACAFGRARPRGMPREPRRVCVTA